MILFIFLIGLSVGSFINVLESRLYKGEEVFKKPSHCDFCGKKLRWSDMVPVLSWIFYGGKSRCCGRRLSWQYPIVEFATGVGFVVIYLRDNIASLFHCFIAGNGFGHCTPPFFLAMEQPARIATQSVAGGWSNGTMISLVFYFFIFVLSFAIFLQDLKYQAIHTRLLQSLIAITLIFNLFRAWIPAFAGMTGEGVIFNFIEMMNFLPAILSALPFFLLYKLSKEKWLGEGDVWIAFWMGLFLGIKVFWALYFGIIIGGVVSLFVLLLHLKKMRDTISLGPFLLLGTLISLFL